MFLWHLTVFSTYSTENKWKFKFPSVSEISSSSLSGLYFDSASFHFVPVIHSRQSSCSCLACPDCFCSNPASSSLDASEMQPAGCCRTFSRHCVTSLWLLQVPTHSASQCRYPPVDSGDLPAATGTLGAEQNSIVLKGQNLPSEQPYEKPSKNPTNNPEDCEATHTMKNWTQVCKQIPVLQVSTGLVLNDIQSCSVSAQRLEFHSKWGTSAGNPDAKTTSLLGFHSSPEAQAPPVPGSPHLQSWEFAFCLTTPLHFSLRHSLWYLRLWMKRAML